MMGTDYPENILPDDDGVGFLAAVSPILTRPMSLRQSRRRAAGRRRAGETVQGQAHLFPVPHTDAYATTSRKPGSTS
jgi:hypothetical protein